MVIWVGGLVFWVVRKMCREYRAVKRVVRPVIMMVVVVQLNVEVIIIISPVKLIEGGRAMFIRLASSHHVVINGSVSCSPRVRSIVRVCTRS